MPATAATCSDVASNVVNRGETKVPHAWYAALSFFRIGYACPPRSLTICFAIRAAPGSASIANGTPWNDGRDPRTNVISGCTEATAAPLRRKISSSSLVRAPLECTAIRPAQEMALARRSAALPISPSGTQNQTAPARKLLGSSVNARAPTSCTSFCARARDPRRERPRERPIIASISYPAARSETPKALAKFPAPTIAMMGLPLMPGRIADLGCHRSPHDWATCRKPPLFTSGRRDLARLATNRPGSRPALAILSVCRNLPLAAARARVRVCFLLARFTKDPSSRSAPITFWNRVGFACAAI